MVPGIGKLPYEDRLQICNLTTLEQRRQRGDAIEVFKMLNGLTSVDTSKLFSFTNQRHDVPTRSATNNCLVSEKCRLDIRKHFFCNRVVQNWNNLPLDVRETSSVNNFKILYDDFTYATCWYCTVNCTCITNTFSSLNTTVYDYVLIPPNYQIQTRGTVLWYVFVMKNVLAVRYYSNCKCKPKMYLNIAHSILEVHTRCNHN